MNIYKCDVNFTLVVCLIGLIIGIAMVGYVIVDKYYPNHLNLIGPDDVKIIDIVSSPRYLDKEVSITGTFSEYKGEITVYSLEGWGGYIGHQELRSQKVKVYTFCDDECCLKTISDLTIVTPTKHLKIIGSLQQSDAPEKLFNVKQIIM